MIQNLITEYKYEPFKHSLYAGKAMLRRGYYIANADEGFYKYVGENSCYSLLELIDSHDAEAFEQAVAFLEQGPQHLLCRIEDKDNRYSLFYLQMEATDTYLDGFALISVELYDFMQLKDKYVEYLGNIRKYRQFMSLLPSLFYEYSYENDRLLLYQYVSQKSIPIHNETLANSLEYILQDQTISQEEKKQFFNFCEVLRTKEERYEVYVPAKFLTKQNVDGSLLFKGVSMYQLGEKKLNVGIVEAAGILKHEEQFYRTQNAFDSATGLFNKRAINEYAIERISECRQTGESIYFAVVDVDEFKTINDQYGHMVGDEVLAQFAEILRAVIDARGYCGRFGGDEFLIVLDRIDSEESLRRILKTVMNNLRFAFQNRFPVTTSWGISQYPKDGKTYEELFQIADKALYIAKYKGKNRFIIYDEAKHGKIENLSEKNKVSGIRALVNDTQKAKIISDLIIRLHHDKKKSIPYVMEVVQDYFDLDGIAVYTGEDMHRTYQVGSYVEPILYLSCIKDCAYLDLFDTAGVYRESTIQKLKNLFPEAYQMYEKQETGAFLQCALKQEGQVVSVVSFDSFNRSPKMGNTDLGFLTIIGRLLAEVACER